MIQVFVVLMRISSLTSTFTSTTRGLFDLVGSAVFNTVQFIVVDR
jgi:hypothetical protein